MATASEIMKEDSMSDHVQETPVPTQNNARKSPNQSTSWQLGKSLGESLLHLYEHSLWTDVRFKCIGHDADNIEDRIRAHRAILAARSPVFQAMFFGPFADGKEEQELPTIEAGTFNLVVRYMYSDKTDLTEDVAAKVMEIAHMYQIQGLVEYCANYLMTVVRVDNACEILELALFYKTEDLQDAACDFIDGNATSVLQSDKFLDISESCLTYILQGDTFNAEENDIVTVVDRWAEKRLVGCSEIPNNKVGIRKRGAIGLGFHYLRVPTLTVTEFLECFKGKGYYNLEEMEELIEYIVMNVTEFRTCVVGHSTVARVPQYDTLTMEYDRNLKSYLKELRTEIQCDLLLNVTADCMIKHVKLYNNLIFFHSSKEITSKVCFVLRGKLTIHDVFEKEFTWIPSDTDEINLERFIPLREQDLPYTLTLSLVLEKEKDIFVSVDRNARRSNRGGGCKNDCHADECISKLIEHVETGKVIDLEYCKESYAVNIIKSIEISVCSNRKMSNDTKSVPCLPIG